MSDDRRTIIDQEFKDKALEKLGAIDTRLAVIETNTETTAKQVDEHDKTLHGSPGREGTTGMIKDLTLVQERQAMWVRGMLLFGTLLTALQGLFKYGGAE